MKKHTFRKKAAFFFFFIALSALFCSLLQGIFSKSLLPSLLFAFLSAIIFACLAILNEKEKKENEKYYKEFISASFHDLRSPITSISGFAAALLEDKVKKEDEARYLSVIKDESERLAGLISSLLDVSRLDRGATAPVYSDFRLHELLVSSLFPFEEKIEKKALSVELDVDEGLWVYSDREALARVVTNLYHNAVKFSNAGGGLRVSAKADGGKVSVTVYNTGRGIEAEKLPHIFNPFYKGEDGDTGEANSGLGLYIVKGLLDSLGEDIRAESEKDSFCSFTFTLKNSKKGKEI